MNLSWRRLTKFFLGLRLPERRGNALMSTETLPTTAPQIPNKFFILRSPMEVDNQAKMTDRVSFGVVPKLLYGVSRLVVCQARK